MTGYLIQIMSLPGVWSPTKGVPVRTLVLWAPVQTSYYMHTLQEIYHTTSTTLGAAAASQLTRSYPPRGNLIRYLFHLIVHLFKLCLYLLFIHTFCSPVFAVLNIATGWLFSPQHNFHHGKTLIFQPCQITQSDCNLCPSANNLKLTVSHGWQTFVCMFIVMMCFEVRYFALSCLVINTI